MVIHGLQKMTLLDFPGHIACTVFTGGCNFRCPFCHNALLVTELTDDGIIPEDEFFSFLDKRHGLLDGVCVTGGEPLLSKGITDFLRRIKSMGFLLKLDTNGSFPDILSSLIDEKIPDYVAMDIKNSKEKYALTAGADKSVLPLVEKSVEILLKDNVDYEFRTTVVGEYHTPEDIRDIASWISGAKRYFIQGFKDSGDLIGKEKMSAPTDEDLRKMLSFAQLYIPNAELRGIS